MFPFELADNVYTSIRGEVFDLPQVAAAHHSISELLLLSPRRVVDRGLFLLLEQA